MTKAAIGGSAEQSERAAGPSEIGAQPQTIEATLKTGRTVVLRELHAGEVIRIDELVPIEKAISIGSLRTIACIREINGQKLPFPTSYREAMATAQRLLARELMEIQYLNNKHFGFDAEVDLSKD